MERLLTVIFRSGMEMSGKAPATGYYFSCWFPTGLEGSIVVICAFQKRALSTHKGTSHEREYTNTSIGIWAINLLMYLIALRHVRQPCQKPHCPFMSSGTLQKDTKILWSWSRNIWGSRTTCGWIPWLPSVHLLLHCQGSAGELT